MTQSTYDAQDVYEAIRVFLKELPDPASTQEPVISAKFLIDRGAVTLEAKKTKGMEKAIWNVGVGTVD